MFRSCSSRAVHGNLVGGRSADARGEAGHPAVDELDALRPQDRVVGEAEEDPVRRPAVEVAQGLDDLLGDEGRDPGVEGVAEVRQPGLVGRDRREEIPRDLQRDAGLLDGLDFVPGEGERQRQVERGVRELEASPATLGLEGLGQLGLGLGDVPMCSPDGGAGNDPRHVRCLC